MCSPWHQHVRNTHALPPVVVLCKRQILICQILQVVLNLFQCRLACPEHIHIKHHQLWLLTCEHFIQKVGCPGHILESLSRHICWNSIFVPYIHRRTCTVGIAVSKHQYVYRILRFSIEAPCIRVGYSASRIAPLRSKRSSQHSHDHHGHQGKCYGFYYITSTFLHR